MATGAVAVPGSLPPMQSLTSYQIPPFHQANPALRPFLPFPNGYAAPPAGHYQILNFQLQTFNSFITLSILFMKKKVENSLHIIPADVKVGGITCSLCT
ncbi:hypothetical protein TanjilG_15933 [Lupinus angustifolius]|uniref:Uncharacterized protein n=1 Tax=Lupinus angustifolius TaxID=3871 RepID=A0A4P1RGE0_LUPAN|nr:hypothetical protein TanjilG_15933 [Lupinus angustifolius]